MTEPAPRKLPGNLNTNRRLDRWLRINRDGTVTVFPGKVEIGQGILTALAQIVAEELDVALERIRLAPANTSYSPDEGMTSGSQSITDDLQRWNFVRNAREAYLLFRTHETLGQRCFRQQKRVRDFSGGEPTESAKCQSDLSFTS